jgi:hypothetical protein
MFSPLISPKNSGAAPMPATQAWANNPILASNISFFIAKSKINFLFAFPARKQLHQEKFCGTVKL